MFSKLFRKKVTAFEFGGLLYYAIWESLFKDQEGSFSLNEIIKRLEVNKNELSKNYEIEIIVSIIYQALFLIHNNFHPPISYLLYTGLVHKFLEQCKDIGISEEDVKNIDKLIEIRLKEYSEAEKNSTLWGPSYWIEKELYENIVGSKQDITDMNANLKIMICSQFLTSYLEILKNIILQGNKDFKIVA